jgi:hypothetical protein
MHDNNGEKRVDSFLSSRSGEISAKSSIFRLKKPTVSLLFFGEHTLAGDISRLLLSLFLVKENSFFIYNLPSAFSDEAILTFSSS